VTDFVNPAMEGTVLHMTELRCWLTGVFIQCRLSLCLSSHTFLLVPQITKHLNANTFEIAKSFRIFLKFFVLAYLSGPFFF